MQSKANVRQSSEVVKARQAWQAAIRYFRRNKKLVQFQQQLHVIVMSPDRRRHWRAQFASVPGQTSLRAMLATHASERRIEH